MNALLRVYGDVQKTDFVIRSEESSDGAEIPAPSSLDEKDEHDEQDEDDQGDREKKVWNEFPWVQDKNRDGPGEDPYRTDVREDEADEIGGDKNQADEQDIFRISEVLLRLISTKSSGEREFLYLSCNPSRPPLKQTDWAGPAAYRSSGQYTKESDDEKRKNE